MLTNRDAEAGPAPLDGGTGPNPPGSAAGPTRRQLVRVALQGAAVPMFGAAWVGGPAVAQSAAPAGAAASAPLAGAAGGPSGAQVVRDFRDPYLELLRLLNVAAEIEHGLMVQYLYCAFSVKPAYQGLVGYGAPNPNELLGIAVQEMQHLGKVNQLLVALGAAPVLIRDDFPYEPDIMPFRLVLEPMSRNSLAKYVWTESPPGATDLRQATSVEDRMFCHDLDLALGKDRRPNFVGDLYDAVISAVKELDATKERTLPDLQAWVPVLKDIKAEGEVGHYKSFRRAFLGNHAGFGAQPDVWRRPVSDPLYPAYALPVDPTAYIGHANQIEDPATQRLAWLGNLHYWSVLNLLSIGYSTGSQDLVAMSRGHMMGPFLSLARQLAKMGSGMPFDPLGQGYMRSAHNGGSTRYLRHLLTETDGVEKHIGKALPSDYPPDFCRATETVLAQLEPSLRVARAPTQPWNDGLA